MLVTSALYVMCLMLVHTEANEQSWSQQAYLDVEYTLSCNDSFINVTVTGDVTGVWTKLGHDGDLTTDDNYELTDRNLSLVIKKVTNEMAGIYFCEVFAENGEYVGRAVRGLNVVEHLYRDLLDKYRENVIRGIATAASVTALVVGVCLIGRSRCQSGEQKESRRDRKDNDKRRESQTPLEGTQNDALEEDSGAYIHYGSLRVDHHATPM